MAQNRNDQKAHLSWSDSGFCDTIDIDRYIIIRSAPGTRWPSIPTKNNNNVADVNVPSGRQSLQSSLEREADAFAAVRIVQQQVASSESSQINVPQPQADKEAVPVLDVDRLFRKAVRAAEELDGIATIEPSEESVFSARSVSSADGDDDDGSDDDDDEDLCSVQQPVIAASAVAPPDLPPPPLPPLLNRAAFDRVLESATGTDRASLEAKIEAIDVELRALRKLGNEQRRAMYAASGLPLTTGARRVALGLFCLLLLFLGARRSGYAFANATRRVTVDKDCCLPIRRSPKRLPTFRRSRRRGSGSAARCSTASLATTTALAGRRRGPTPHLSLAPTCC
jgi:hypothetical protein